MNAFGTKVSKSKLGSPRFPKHDKPVNNEVKTYTLSPEELEYYRQKGKIEMGGKTMKPEQTQKKVETVNLDEQLEQLEREVVDLSQHNVHLQNLLDDLQSRYNQLAIEHETAEQVRYDLTRTEGQRDQLKASLRETEDILFKEVDRRDLLEKLLKMYLP